MTLKGRLISFFWTIVAILIAGAVIMVLAGTGDLNWGYDESLDVAVGIFIANTLYGALDDYDNLLRVKHGRKNRVSSIR